MAGVGVGGTGSRGDAGLVRGKPGASPAGQPRRSLYTKLKSQG